MKRKAKREGKIRREERENDNKDSFLLYFSAFSFTRYTLRQGYFGRIKK